MTDYFSKWIEADSFRQVTDKEVISFIRKNIICRYGISLEIICDNGTQFVGKRTKAFCTEWNINQLTSTPSYPKANGQAESSNKTPYSLVYDCEAVIPPEVHVPTSRYSLNNIEANADLMQDSLVLTEELGDSAKFRIASYQQTVTKSYNMNVKIIVFREGNLVLRKVFPNKKEKSADKLSPVWEGPYLIDSIVGQGAYRLQTIEGEVIPRSWNVEEEFIRLTG
ncbi:uncharacterized protein LOC141590289 [Silene latifolia]|uniref:uncharacterized protein LOC141590289 n=1 Tax=Silene latifolia TaxID=37657 RepID=UPI003D770FD5